MGAMTIPSLMEERYGKGTKTSGEVQIIKDIAQRSTAATCRSSRIFWIPA